MSVTFNELSSAEDLALGVEVVRAMLARTMCEQTMWFQAIDTDGSGDIDVQEFRAAVAAASPMMPVPDSVSDAIFAEMDIDGNGSLSHGEYLRFMLRDTLKREAGNVMRVLFAVDLANSRRLRLVGCRPTGEIDKVEVSERQASRAASHSTSGSLWRLSSARCPHPLLPSLI